MRCATILILLSLPACGDDGALPVDAMPDVPTIPGDFSCSSQALPTVGPDPAELKGLVIDLSESGIGGVAVEVHAVTGDTLLASATSNVTNVNLGKYSVSVATGAASIRTYRKLVLSGYLDSYGYDPRPTSATVVPIGTLLFTAAELDTLYAQAGVTRDPAKGTVWLDIHDCMPDYLALATVDAPSGRVFYVDDALAIQPSLVATSTAGGVLVLNVDPGEADFTVHAGPVVYRSWPVVVHAGALTQSDRFP